MTDEELTIDSAVDEVDLLVMRHGIIGGSYRYLRRHTSARAWIRMALFVAATWLLWTSLQTVAFPGDRFGFTTTTLGPIEAGVWTLFTMVTMYAVWKVLDEWI